MNKQKRVHIFEQLKSQNPHPATELKYKNPFELLVAVVLSAQATDISVNNATEKLFAIANTPESILRLGTNGLKKYIRSIGLYNTKAANIVKTCKIILEQHHGNVPDNREALETLPGVGRKTANVILNTAFGKPTIAVDTHIFRVSNRTGIAPGKNVLEVENKLLKFVPDEYKPNVHHWLILHGRYVCLARKPRCCDCVIYNLCEWKEKKKYGR